MEWGQVHIFIAVFKPSWVLLREYLQAVHFSTSSVPSDRAGHSSETDREMHTAGATPLLHPINWALMWSRGPASYPPLASLLPFLFGQNVLGLGRCLVCSFPSLTCCPWTLFQLCRFYSCVGGFLSWFFFALFLLFSMLFKCSIMQKKSMLCKLRKYSETPENYLKEKISM